MMRKGKKSGCLPLPRKELDSSTVNPGKLADYMARIRLGDPAPVLTFENMNLKPQLLKGIYEYKNYEKPTQCQQKIILPCIQGRDVICQAQSGSGKTAAFCISILQRVDPNKPNCQALVMAPTRELAQQIWGDFQALGKYLNVNCVKCYGGTNPKANEYAFTSGKKAQIAVGTLGRVLSLVRNKILDLDTIEMLVVDEVDKMINIVEAGSFFNFEMKYILRNVSATAQIIVMSATLQFTELWLARTYLRKPYEALLKRDKLKLDGFQQFYYIIPATEKKVEVLSEIFPDFKSARGFIFCRTRRRAEKLSKKMKNRGHPISEIMGTQDQWTRNQRLESFRSGAVPYLISTDLLGRGIEVDNVQLVINFDIVDDRFIDRYIHRVSRAGRCGKKGMAITILKYMDVPILHSIESRFDTEILPMPDNVGELLNTMVTTKSQ